MNFTLYQYKYISKDDSTYLKGLAILIMICLHVFGSRAVNLPAYQQMDDFVFMGRPLSFCLSRFCSICVHIYIYCQADMDCLLFIEGKLKKVWV